MELFVNRFCNSIREWDLLELRQIPFFLFMKTSRILLIIALPILAIGLSVLWWGYGFYQDTDQLLKNGIRAPGQVTDLIEQRDSDMGKLYYPEITFEDTAKKEVTFKTNVGTYPPSNKVGDQVEVIYPAGHPEKAQSIGFFSLWIGALICGLIGGIFTIIGAGVLIGAIINLKQNN